MFGGLEIAGGEIHKKAEEIGKRMPGFFDKMETPTKVDLTKPVDYMGKWEMKSVSDGFDSEQMQDTRDDRDNDEINEMQKNAVQEAMERIKNGEKLTDIEKGNLGEMLMDLYYISQGYEPLHTRVTSLEDKGHQGIDGVYEKADAGKPQYVVADAKATDNSPQLRSTVDGTKQMSDEWIDKRLDHAVGKDKADEIRDSYEDDASNVSREVYHYETKPDGDGNTKADVCTVDENGEKNNDKEVVQIFDRDGKEIYKKAEEMV